MKKIILMLIILLFYSSVSWADVLCDINGDGKVGLAEAVYALQIAAGMNIDLDGDGVSDDLDQCPWTPVGEAVDQNGCSASQDDYDGDGIRDVLDNCIGVSNSGQEDFDADGYGDVCDEDSDSDMVKDDADLCLWTPGSEPVDSNGCSDSQKDTDRDGIKDLFDNCIRASNAGQEDFDGDGYGDVCDDDSDSDMVNDNADLCLWTPNGEPVDSNGCSDSQKGTGN